MGGLCRRSKEPPGRRRKDMTMMRLLTRFLAVLAIAAPMAACGVNNVPTLEEQPRPNGPMCRTSISAAPT
jgi:hypothetical protein